MDAAVLLPAEAPLYLVTVLYNSRDCLPAFAASLAAQDFFSWRLIAVDNAPADGGGAWLAGRDDPRIKIVRNPRNLGFARAANQGLRAALAEGAEFVVLLNNDTVLPEDFLGRFRAWQRRLGAEVIAPRIMQLRRPEESWYAGGHLDHGWILRNIHEPYDPATAVPARVVEFASACCLGLSRAVLARTGLFDESFFLDWEDVDFCLRLARAGVAIHYVSDVFLLHEGGHASGGEFSAAYNRHYYRSYAQMLRKHFGGAVAWRMALRIALKELGRPHRRWPRLLATLSGLARGLAAPLR